MGHIIVVHRHRSDTGPRKVLDCTVAVHGDPYPGHQISDSCGRPIGQVWSAEVDSVTTRIHVLLADSNDYGQLETGVETPFGTWREEAVSPKHS